MNICSQLDKKLKVLTLSKVTFRRAKVFALVFELSACSRLLQRALQILI